MKVLDKIDRSRHERFPVTGRFAAIDTRCGMIPLSERPEHWRLKYGFSVYCTIVGPEKASNDMVDKARRQIAREIFGEITDDLFELNRMLLEEHYRPSDDPAITIIDNLIRKTRGERA